MMKLQSDCLEERISAYQCQGSKDLNISKPLQLMTLWLYIIYWSFFWCEVLLMWLVSRCYLCHTWIQLVFMAPRLISFVVSRADDSYRRDIESSMPLLFPQTDSSTKQIFWFGKWHVLILLDTWYGGAIRNLNGDDAPYENKRWHCFLTHCEVIVHLNWDINLKNAWKMLEM